METIGDDFERRMAASWPVATWQDLTILVAVSGGADSVALLRSLDALRTGGPGRLIVAHCNHQLRGAESDADAAFVSHLCHELGIPCEVGLVQVSDQGNGLEDAARDARYHFLTDAAGRCGARYLVTAHTADDQAETILHRILRGTSLAGLAGIPRVRPMTELVSLIRPLLWARRSEVLAYLARLGQDYLADSSNELRTFTRNRLRHDLLPQLAREYNPAVVEALLRLGQLSGEAQEVLGKLASDLLENAATRRPGGDWEVRRSLVAAQPRYLIREMFLQLWRTSGWPLQAMGLAQWDMVADMATLTVAPRKCTMPGSIEIECAGNQETLMIRRLP